MLSEHELVTAVETKLYPQTQQIESICRALFNKQFSPGRGPLGMCGSNELDFTLQLLGSATAYLRRLANEHQIDIGGFERLEEKTYGGQVSLQ